ncbi:MAG: DegT/DnrJ/EryC1/StrS family aminotransferase [Luteolibacter sp.]|uniref:DegT/DnrJ/EryC1/StrS family aminotransferase n=1 Tax=Luteolibacter sp. TaxID=1962973 RepID=UPI0032657684
MKIITLPHEPAVRWPVFDSESEAAVLQILRDGNVSTHPVIRELEQDYEAFTGRRHALAHNNGTSALLAAFHALGLQPGDEILVPTATFWASVLPMIWCGIIPVFCESEPVTLGIDPADMWRKITSRTKAVVIVHLWGLPCQVDEIQQVCDEFDLRIIEDASHAHGAVYHGRNCGAVGDISVFSLQGDKLAPAGEGGILLTDNADYLERAACLGDITRIIELDSPARRFAATGMGIKTRIAPMSAALGRVSLRKLTESNRVRNENHRWLSECLENLGFDCFLPPTGIGRVYFEFLIRHRDPAFETSRFMDRLQSLGGQVSTPRYPLLHEQPLFREGHVARIGRFPEDVRLPDYAGISFPQTEHENRRLIKLPNFCHPCEKLLEQYRDAFEHAVRSH